MVTYLIEVWRHVVWGALENLNWMYGGIVKQIKLSFIKYDSHIAEISFVTVELKDNLSLNIDLYPLFLRRIKIMIKLYVPAKV